MTSRGKGGDTPAKAAAAAAASEELFRGATVGSRRSERGVGGRVGGGGAGVRDGGDGLHDVEGEGGAAMAMVEPRTTADVLRDALGTTSETNEIGATTLTELQRQREQIERVQKKVDETEAHADRSHGILGGMKSIFVSWTSSWHKKPDLPKDVVAKREAERAAKHADGVARAESAAITAGEMARVSAMGAGGSDIKVSTDPRYAEEDAILAMISANLHETKAIGTAMKSELTLQDTMIDDLGVSIDRTKTKVAAAEKDARKLARG